MVLGKRRAARNEREKVGANPYVWASVVKIVPPPSILVTAAASPVTGVFLLVEPQTGSGPAKSGQ